MTQIRNVTRNDDGQYEITDAAGKLVEGPFETNSAAWKALDRLDNDDASRPDRKRSNRPVLWGKKDQTSRQSKKEKKRSTKKAAKQEKQMKRDANKAVGWVRDIASVKFDPQANRAYRDYKLGTFGAASDVKRIDPAVYLAEKAARGEG